MTPGRRWGVRVVLVASWRDYTSLGSLLEIADIGVYADALERFSALGEIFAFILSTHGSLSIRSASSRRIRERSATIPGNEWHRLPCPRKTGRAALQLPRRRGSPQAVSGRVWEAHPTGRTLEDLPTGGRSVVAVTCGPPPNATFCSITRPGKEIGPDPGHFSPRGPGDFPAFCGRQSGNPSCHPALVLRIDPGRRTPDSTMGFLEN